MTDYGQGAEPMEPVEPESREPVEDIADEAPVPEGTSDFSSGEGLVAMAGIVLLIVWIIFEVIFTEYFVSTLGVALALAAAIVPRLNRDSVEKVHRIGVIMKVLGYALVLNGIVEIVSDVRFDAYDSVMAVFGALAAYAAYAMAFMGARSIKT